ncbi:hypothetical protein, partial [Helicobacter sp. 23-1045]
YKDEEYCQTPHYSFYGFRDDLDYSFGYFISNLLEFLKIRRTGKEFDDDEIRRFYPISGGGKEIYRIESCEIGLGNGR